MVDLAFLIPAKVGDQYGDKYMLQEEDYVPTKLGQEFVLADKKGR